MNTTFLIKNGHVIDPEENVDGIRDIAINGRTIADPGEDLVSQYPVINAKGCYVVPGLIDFHLHLFDTGSGLGIRPDLLLATGVTTAVDAGSAGCSNYDAFHRTEVEGSLCRVRSVLNITSGGMFQVGYPEDYDPAFFMPDKIAEVLAKYRQEIFGLKMRFSKETIGKMGINPLLRLIEIAQSLGVPVVIHTTDPPTDTREIVARLRTGDIYCHCYQGVGNTILNENGKVYKEMWEARERGVLFDASSGKMNFSMEVARKAMDDGFYPDIVSSDIIGRTFSKPYIVKNLPFLMSKMMMLGMSLQQVVKAATAVPARVLGMEGEIGTLKAGACADVTILKMIEKETVFKDSGDAVAHGNRILLPVMTIRNGEVVYCSNEFWD